MHFGFIKNVAPDTERLIVGLDVGTTKICAVVGETGSAGMISTGRRARAKDDAGSTHPASLFDGSTGSGVHVIGTGTSPSKGIKKGDVSSIELAVDAIRKAVREAEAQSGVDIKAVHLSITGRHIDCLSSHGVVAVRDGEIRQRDVDNVVEAAKAVAIPFDREMIHVLPAGFSVNGQNGITDPRGMGGIRLETNVQIITGASTSIQNLVRCCQKAGLEVTDIGFQPLAAAEAVLSHDEKNLGAAVVDIGGGTTDIALFREGAVCHAAVVSIGGNNFTNDLAVGLRIPMNDAEDIKRKHGCAMLSLVREDETLEIKREDRKIVNRIPRRYLVEILQPRAEELFGLVKEEILGKGFYHYLNSGVVLTGGSAAMEGMDVMAENILELPVRLGFPAGIQGVSGELNSPQFAASIGLVCSGANDMLNGEEMQHQGVFRGIRNRIRGLFSEMLSNA